MLVPITQKGCGASLSKLGRYPEAEEHLLQAWKRMKRQKDGRHRQALTKAILEHYERSGQASKKAAFQEEISAN